MLLRCRQLGGLYKVSFGEEATAKIEKPIPLLHVKGGSRLPRFAWKALLTHQRRDQRYLLWLLIRRPKRNEMAVGHILSLSKIMQVNSKMVEGMSNMLSQDSTVDSSSSTPCLTLHDEITVMQAVLNKPRRDFTVGIGRRVPGGSRDAPESSASGCGGSSSSLHMIPIEEHTRKINKLQNQLDQTRQNQKKQFKYLVHYIRQQNPGAPPIPEEEFAQLFPQPPHSPPQLGEDSNDDDNMAQS